MVVAVVGSPGENTVYCLDPHTCSRKALNSFPNTHASSHPQKG